MFSYEADTAFILGAGFSKEAKLPTTPEFAAALFDHAFVDELDGEGGLGNEVESQRGHSRMEELGTDGAGRVLDVAVRFASCATPKCSLL